MGLRAGAVAGAELLFRYPRLIHRAVGQNASRHQLLVVLDPALIYPPRHVDLDRVAHVFAGPSSRGSGYVIARQLVLTADHVIEAFPGALTVLTVGALQAGGRRVPARVAWRDVEHDLALLTVDEPTDATPVALGKLAGLEPVPVEAVGFPDATVANGSADTLAVHGDCLADSGRVHGRVQVRVGSLVPRRREGWRGLSGAALFAGDFLVGVLRQVPEAFGEGVLDASALAPVLSDANLSTLLRDSGVAPTPRSVDADDARPFGASGFAEVAADYSNALVASFRLDGAGLAVDGASRHALALGQAYGGTRYALPGEPQPVSLADLPARRLRLALVGPPGSGKSITLKRLLVDVAKRERRVPVYLRLAEFAAAGDISAPALVRAFAAQAERQGVPQADVRLFDRLLTYGLAAVALDGLDEVGGRTLREAVVSAIGALSDSAPNARIVIASRPAEFAETPLPRPTRHEVPSFVEAQTTPLGDDQIRHFLRDSFDDDGRLWRVIRRIVGAHRTRAHAAPAHADRDALGTSPSANAQPCVVPGARGDSCRAVGSNQSNRAGGRQRAARPGRTRARDAPARVGGGPAAGGGDVARIGRF